MGAENEVIWSEIGSRFGEAGSRGTPLTSILRSIPRNHAIIDTREPTPNGTIF